MTPPLACRAPIQSETFHRIDPVCEAPRPNCSTELAVVEDEASQSSYLAEIQTCFEEIRRIPGFNLFQRFPELRQRLEEINRPGAPSNLSPRNAPPAATPRNAPPPSSQAAPSNRPSDSNNASSQGSPATTPSSLRILGAAAIGAIGGAAARGAARVLRALSR